MPEFPELGVPEFTELTDALMDGQDTQLETGNSGGESLGMRTSVTGFFAF